MTKKMLLLLSMITVLLLPCLGNAAPKEFRLLTWKGYAPAELVEKFEKETGYKVQVTYSNNEEMIAKLRATRGGGFDLAQPSQDRISSVQESFGLYQPIDFGRIEAARFIPSMLDAVKKNTLVKGKSYAVPFCWGTDGLIVNRKFAPEAKSFADLLDAKYAGRASYRLKRPTLIAQAFGMGIDPFKLYTDEAAYQKMLDQVEGKLIAAKGVVKNYWTNGDALLESMRSGEVHIAQAWDNGGFKLHAENPDIDFVAPTTGALGWIDTFAIPAKADNADAAYKWINFMMRPENAAVFTNAEDTPTAAVGVGERLKPTFRADFERCYPQQVIDNIKWYPPVPAKLEAMEGKALDRVKAAQ